MTSWTEAQNQAVTTTAEIDRIRELQDRMGEADVTLDEIHELLELNHKPSGGMVQQPIEQFIVQDDLAALKWLQNWWDPVLDKPQDLQTPTVPQFLWFINYAPGAEPVTFNNAMMQFYHRCVNWCRANGLDVDHPSESATERKRRRNRERMADVRAHRTPKKLDVQSDPQVRARYKELQEQLEEIQIKAAKVEQQLKEQTLEYQRLMNETASERKARATEFRSKTKQIKEEMRKLSNNS